MFWKRTPKLGGEFQKEVRRSFGRILGQGNDLFLEEIGEEMGNAVSGVSRHFSGMIRESLRTMRGSVSADDDMKAIDQEILQYLKGPQPAHRRAGRVHAFFSPIVIRMCNILRMGGDIIGQGPARRLVRNMALQTLVVVVLIAVVAGTSPVKDAISATFSWVQTDWSGGTDGGAVATHPGNQTGWNKYSSVTNVDVTTSPGNADLPFSSYTTTDDGTLTTTGSATGGGFPNGTMSNVEEIGGTAPTASMRLTSSSTPFNQFAVYIPGNPNQCSAGSMNRGVHHQEGEDATYVFCNYTAGQLAKYSAATNTWTKLANAPSSISYPRIFRPPASDYLYIFAIGYGSAYQYRISTNTWTTITATSGVFSLGTATMGGPGNDIYVFSSDDTDDGEGGVYFLNSFRRYNVGSGTWTGLPQIPGTSDVFAPHVPAIAIGTSTAIFVQSGLGDAGWYKFTIATNTWTAMASAPAALASEYGLERVFWDGTSSDIYVLNGAGTTSLYKYSISGNSWTTLTAPPIPVNDVTSFVRSGTSDSIYYLSYATGPTRWNMYRYSVSANTWTQLASQPDGAQRAVIDAAGGYILAPGGASSSALSRYAIATDSWQTTVSVLATPPTTFAAPFYAVRGAGEDAIYTFSQGGGSAGYSIATNGWTTLASPGASLATEPLHVASEDFIYAGFTSSVLKKYSISGNTWTNLANAPGSFGGGTQTDIMRRENENFIYLVPGGASSSFYRYSISGNSWTTLAAHPNGTANDNVLVSTPGEDYIYLFTNSKLARYSISGNSWTALTNPPYVNVFTALRAFRAGADDAIYVSPGSSFGRDFYKYSIAGNSWTKLADVAGAGITINSPEMTKIAGDDVLYLRASGNETYNGIYRYTVSSNTWTRLTGAAPTFNAAGPILRNGSDAEMYAFTSTGAGGKSILRFLTDIKTYAPSGTFTSATIDIGAKSFGNLSWGPTVQPSEAGADPLKFQVAANSDNTTWNYVGPDGTSGTYFTSSGTAIPAALNGSRYFRYKAFFSTALPGVTAQTNGVTPTLDFVTIPHETHRASGSIVSSVYDALDATSVIAAPRWTATTATGSSVKFQLRSAASSAGVASAAWKGPDGTATSYFTDPAGGTTTHSSMRDGSGDRYFQYQAIFTSDGSSTPVLADVTNSYVINGPPEVRNVTASQGADGIVSIAYEVRDPDGSTGSITPGFVTPSFEYWDGAAWQPAATLSAGATSDKVADDTNWSSYSATWTPTADFPNRFMGDSAKIRVKANDNEAANNVASADSATFTLDTKNPSSPSIVVDASTVPATITLSATDDSARFMMISSNPTLFGGSYVAFSSTSTFTLPSNPATLYAKFKDAYGNESSVVSATTPETPSAVIIQDNANLVVTPPEYRLFVAWKTVANPALGFGNYAVERSSDGTTWATYDNVTNRLANYFIDASILPNVNYRYRLKTVDVAGNTSYNSVVVMGLADGAVSGGEGGGGGGPPPIISNINVSEISPGSARVTWDTDILSNSAVGYSTSTGAFTNETSLPSMVDNSGGVGGHDVILSGLAPATTYYFRVRSTNIGGTTATDDNNGAGYTFTTQSGPAISNTGTARVEDVTNTTATIVWRTNTASDSAVIWSANPDFSAPNTTDAPAPVTDHEIRVTGLSQNTKYFFYVRSTDASGTEYDKNIFAGVTRYYSFTTTADSVPPVISQIGSSASSGSAIVTWTTDEKADSQVEYGPTAAYGSSTALDATLTAQHAVTVPGLTSGATYHFRIKTKDADGNLATSTDQTFTTTTVADATAPVISAVATSGVSLSGATVTWTTDENSSSFVDYGTSTSYGALAGAVTDSVTSHSVTLSDLAGNTAYYFRVRSTDAAGNVATDDNAGAGYTFTTQADATPPVISEVVTSLIADTSADITWTTNEPANAKVVYGTTAAYGSETPVTATYGTKQVVTLTGLTKQTQYFYKVVSADPTGNSAENDNAGAGYTFTTTDQPGIVATVRAADTRDTSAPLIMDLKIDEVTAGAAKASWTTSEGATGVLAFGKTAAYGQAKVAMDQFLVSQSFVVDGLEPDTEYHVKAYALDPSGNRSESEDRVFRTLTKEEEAAKETAQGEVAAEEAVPPAAEESAEPPKPPEPTVAERLQTSLDDFLSDPKIGTVPEETLVKLVTDFFTRLISAPAIAAEGPRVEVQGTTATIRWTTDRKSTTMLAYAHADAYKPGSKEPYVAAAVAPDELSTSHEIQLANLDPSTTYHFQVRSKGVVGPEAKSSDKTFTTAAVLPEISALRVTATTTEEASATWSTNVLTTSTIEYTDTVTKDTLTQGDTQFLRDHKFTLKQLEPGREYRLLVRAKDESGTEAASPPLTFTTTADTVAPEISKITAESTFYPGKETKVQTIIRWDTNEPASSQVFYQEGVKEDGEVTELPKDEALVMQHTVVVTKFKPASVYKFWVVSKDEAGNEARSKDFTILTPQQRETIFDIIFKNFEEVFGWTKQLRL